MMPEKNVPRYHVRAWGTEDHPDLDEFFDAVPADLGWKYPYIDVSDTKVLRLSDVMAAVARAASSGDEA
jgi:hypothetical protein